MSYIRSRLTIALPLATFIFAYFFTTVLGNILYTFPVGRDFPKRSMPDFTWAQFQQPFDGWFWLLVLSPIVATPVLVWLIARRCRSLANPVARLIPELSLPFFAIANVACLAYISHGLYRADAVSKLFAGRSPMEAVWFRFALQEQMGLAPRIVLMSVLQFLSVYTIVRAVRSRQAPWVFFSVLNVVMVSAFFILLNMKWPIILFEITIAAAVFISVQNRYILASGFIFATGIFTYFVISVALLRIPTTIVAPEQLQTTIGRELGQPLPPGMPAGTEGLPPRRDTFTPALQPARSPVEVVEGLFVVAINRMAMSVPFYYDTFTTEGSVCGNFLTKFLLRRPGTCHPSHFIYAKMFPTDGFAGYGTAPAAHQIYEYARAGWIGAAVALILGAAILAFYTLCFFVRQRDVFAAAFAMGIPAAYMLSQLPIEAVTVLENGAIWWILVILANAGLVWAMKKYRAGSSLSTQQL